MCSIYFAINLFLSASCGDRRVWKVLIATLKHAICIVNFLSEKKKISNNFILVAFKVELTLFVCIIIVIFI